MCAMRTHNFRMQFVHSTIASCKICPFFHKYYMHCVPMICTAQVLNLNLKSDNALISDAVTYHLYSVYGCQNLLDVSALFATSQRHFLLNSSGIFTCVFTVIVMFSRLSC